MGVGTLKREKTMRNRGCGAKLRSCVDFFFGGGKVVEYGSTTYKMYGNQRIMKKVNLVSRYEIEKEAQEKKDYTI